MRGKKGKIPVKINGKTNPEYQRWYRTTPKGKAMLKRYNQSEKHAQCAARWYEKSRRGKPYKIYNKNETPEQYAERILADLNESELA